LVKLCNPGDKGLALGLKRRFEFSDPGDECVAFPLKCRFELFDMGAERVAFPLKGDNTSWLSRLSGR